VDGMGCSLQDSGTPNIILCVVYPPDILILQHKLYIYIPIGSMYGIYANVGGILMVNVTIYLPYIAYMDPMGYIYSTYFVN